MKESHLNEISLLLPNKSTTKGMTYLSNCNLSIVLRLVRRSLAINFNLKVINVLGMMTMLKFLNSSAKDILIINSLRS